MAGQNKNQKKLLAALIAIIVAIAWSGHSGHKKLFAVILFVCSIALLISIALAVVLALKKLLTKKYSLKKTLGLYFGAVVCIAIVWRFEWGAIALFWFIVIVIGIALGNDAENDPLTKKEHKVID